MKGVPSLTRMAIEEGRAGMPGSFFVLYLHRIFVFRELWPGMKEELVTALFLVTLLVTKKYFFNLDYSENAGFKGF